MSATYFYSAFIQALSGDFQTNFYNGTILQKFF